MLFRVILERWDELRFGVDFDSKVFLETKDVGKCHGRLMKKLGLI